MQHYLNLLVPNVKVLTLKAHIRAILPDVFAATVTLVLGYIFYKLTARLFRRILLKSRVDDAFSRLLIDSVYKTLVIVGTAITAIGQFGVNIAAPLAGIGVIGLALGFAAKDSLSNIISGFLIFFDKPFRVGDYVTIGSHYGRVELITMRSTRIRTPNNTYVVIPNQQIINDVLIDHTTNGDTRIVVGVLISYEESVDTARKVLLEAVAKIDGVLSTPAPDVVVDLLGDSGVHLLVRVWIKDSSLERRVFFKTTETALLALRGAGINIPYPHIQLKLESDKVPGGAAALGSL